MGALHLTTINKGGFYGIRRFTTIIMGLRTLNGIGILSIQY